MKAWIGLCEVRPRPGNTLLEDAIGACVNVLGLGATESDYRQLVIEAMNGLGLDVLGIEDVGTVEERERAHALVPELAELAKTLSAQEPVQFDEFQAFDA